MTDATIRPYEGGDAEGLWRLKRGFELGIGAETGPDGKAAAYEAKLTDDYRKRWLDWVDRCVDEDGACVNVAVAADGGGEESAGAELVGYSFLLPESLSFVWDAAVLNEIFVAPERRGSSVADGLMDAAVDCARAQDLPLERMVLDVDRENDRAKAFYERYGFSHWGEMVARDL
ncbi:GNAT family N-acetyltransferase [Halogeometricum sp. S1BR25-6]|uniref:GNAT family N-acetyltransferase n=1 Tax=Halogeometricum salsisoli TaxID=2950536 RepID=A0ABU2GF51_9EURY|nr:GNAT family N-acetyltransferase [Halogeometricum sp. S1BR25-6]MDS0299414.1 GNAT family N-acetyltransferase [Halogeometricum sp. S1BR25-6]